jgi:hypothetical protein
VSVGVFNDSGDGVQVSGREGAFVDITSASVAVQPTNNNMSKKNTGFFLCITIFAKLLIF